jgi:hypothetical protein
MPGEVIYSAAEGGARPQQHQQIESQHRGRKQKRKRDDGLYEST